MSNHWQIVRTVILTALLSIGAATVSMAAEPANKVITLRADPSCPSNCEPSNDRPGYDIEIAKKIFGDAGYEVDYKALSWSRTVVEVRNGTFDAFVAGIKDDAPDFLFPQEPAGMLINACVSRKGAGWKWDGVQSLSNKVLGIIPSYQYWPELKDYIDANANNPKRIQPVAMMNALELNLKKLEIGRIDVTCDDISNLRYYSKEMNLTDKIEFSPGIGEQVPNYIAFGPTNPRGPELARLWDAGIQKMRASGELRTILQRYGVSDWK